MEFEVYRLRCTIPAHSSDIRAVAAPFHPDGGLITGSRDHTVKVWQPNRFDNGFSEMNCMRGASHFISSLCVLPASEQYPQGLILAGSHDCAIYGFSPDNAEPVLKLLGHSQNVCTLVAGHLGTVVSGSWDKTARVWLGQKCVAILAGHSEAVWAVALMPDNLVLTGSADKTIWLWRSNKCERKFIGHADCVRGLAVMSDSEFLSCSNDTTIRRWNTFGVCMGIYAQHTDYIYDICTSVCGNYFFSCSEDQTVKVWTNDGFCVQTIDLPAKSLWALTTLRNSDIAVGASDGTVRVFTQLANRVARPSELVTFDQEVEGFKSGRTNIGALELNDVPGAEVLQNSGISDGQTQLCKIGSEVFVYQWSMEEKKWQKLGKVLDAHERPQKPKTVYEGKEYDYVFTIDVAEGKLLKLPYNETDDPHLVAHNFVQEHNLNEVFFDQIVKFILEHSNHKSQVQAESKPGCSDPFTGGSRYIPSDSGEALPVTKSAGDIGVEGLPQSSSAGNETQCEAYFPLVAYITFDKANVSGIKVKLHEFNGKVKESQRLSDEEIESVLLLTNFPLREVADSQMISLEKALYWPVDFVFPALDILRLAVRAECVNSRVSKDGASEFIDHLLRIVARGNSDSNNMLILRTFCNAFIHSSGEQLLLEHAPKIFDWAGAFWASKNKHVQIALSTLYANYIVAFQKSAEPESIYKETCFSNAVKILNDFEDPEAIFRLLVCIGTAVKGSKTYLQKAQNLQIADVVTALEACDMPAKVRDLGAKLINFITTGI